MSGGLEPEGASAGAGAGAGLGRWLTGAALLVAVAYLVYLQAWEPAPFTLTFDDAWYYFAIARNVAEGNGSTFDGLNLTNGYHPLWLLIATVPYRLGMDGTEAPRALLGVQVVGLAAALVLLARTVAGLVGGWPGVSRRDHDESVRARRAASGVLAAVFVVLVGNPYLVKATVNGLESAVVVPLDALLLWLVLRGRGRRRLGLGRRRGPNRDGGSESAAFDAVFVGGSHVRRLGIGLLLAALFLARTDAVLLIGVIGVWSVAELVVARRTGTSSGERGTPVGGSGTFVALLELFVVPGLTIGAYAAWSWATFGTPVQVSGLVKRAPLGVSTVIGAVVVLLLAVVAGVRGFQRQHAGRSGRRRRERFPLVVEAASRTAWFGAFCILLVGYYVVLQTQVWLWYFAPLVFYGMLMLLLAVADTIEATLRAAPTNRRPGVVLLPVLAVFAVPLLGLGMIQAKSFADPSLRSIQEANRAAGEWVARELPADAVLSSWDAGVFGYFADRPVVNLDGVVNSFEFFRAGREGRVGEFLACQRVGYVANHGGGTPAEGGVEDPGIRRFIGRVYGEDAAARAVVVYRVPFEFSGTTTGSEGSETGTRQMWMYVYRIDPATIPPVPASCPTGPRPGG